MSYAEIKALCAGDERIREKMDLDVEVARLKLMKSNYQTNQYRLEDQLTRTFPEEIRMQENCIAGYEADLRILEAHPLPTSKESFVGMELYGRTLLDREAAGKTLLEAAKALPQGTENMRIGRYRGLEMSVHYDMFRSQYLLARRGSMTHTVEMGQDSRGNLIRIENALNGIPERIKKAKEQLDNPEKQMAAAKEELTCPFPQEEELKTKSARLVELDAILNMDRPKAPDKAESRERPSVREMLKVPYKHGEAQKKQPELEER